MLARDILIHWAEIALKGKNRPRFIEQLARNVRQVTADLPVERVHKQPGRLWLTLSEEGASEAALSEVLGRLGLVAGISSYSPCLQVPLEMDALKAAALAVAEDARPFETFRITARRAFKDLPLPSQQVAAEVGAHVVQATGGTVRLKGADLDVRVEMLPSGAFVYGSKHPGLGGLPVGVTGKVCVMLSGGIDSPVAAFRMLRRGCRVSFVHFHSHPFVSKASLEKAEDLAAVLARYQGHGTLHAVPFGEVQRTIVEHTPPPLRVVLYRRFMVRIAGALGAADGCKALVTGEALGQVASQTLTNVVVIDQAAPMPILRPLISFDKLEIESAARAIGTYEISILPDQDCCTLFTPKNPQTHAALDEVAEAEGRLDVDGLVRQALAATERLELYAPWWRERGRAR